MRLNHNKIICIKLVHLLYLLVLISSICDDVQNMLHLRTPYNMASKSVITSNTFTKHRNIIGLF